MQLPTGARALAAGLVLSLWLAPLSAAAQGLPPQACGMDEEHAQYGVEIGAEVTLQRHRFVRGDDNWDPAMARFLGRAAHVTRRGVDQQGCPGVWVDVDAGEYFWRVRDLGIGTGRQPSAFPSQCGQSDDAPVYGAAAIGTEVVLGRHRLIDGDANWRDEMTPYVGRSARIVELAGLDEAGCPGVRVDVDQRRWFWRVRDLRPAPPSEPLAARAPARSTGIDADHGRPAVASAETGSGLFATGGATPPQRCGLSDASVQWAPMQVGLTVVLGRHRPVNGDTNWSEEMDALVGQQARITELVGVDDQGCPVVHIDADQGQYYWRVRDMTIP